MFPDAKQITKEEQNVNPRKLLIVSQPKVGKSRLAMQLEDSLYIDLEDSTDFYMGNARVFNTKKNYQEFTKDKDSPPPYELYVAKYLSSLVERAKKEGPLCKYLIIDTASALQDVAEIVATFKYKATPIGKSFTDDSVLSLSRGSGYNLLRLMFKNLYKQLEPVCSECLILLAHPKDSNIVVDGKELMATQVNLSGKLAQIVTSDMDTMATMFRKPDSNINILSFKTSQKDTISGSRSPHLENTQIEISELKDDGTFVSHWDKIFV